MSIPSAMGDFRKLRAWRAAQELAVDSHRIASRMRGARSSKLSDQLIRAAISVPTTLVEGNAHESPREFSRYIRYSIASASEVEGHVQLARDLGMMTESDYAKLTAKVSDVRMMLYGLLKKLNAGTSKDEPSPPEADNTTNT